MFKSPLYLLGITCFVFVVLEEIAALEFVFGVSLAVIAAVTAVLAVGSCIFVAAKDPTYKVGYWFGAMMAGAAATVAVNLVLVKAEPWYALIAGALCPSAMWATYQFRKWKDIRRLQARYRELGM